MTAVAVSYSSFTPRHDTEFARELRELADIAGAAAHASAGRSGAQVTSGFAAGRRSALR